MLARGTNPISQRIEFLRYVMILAIVVTHVPPDVPLIDMPDDALSFIKAFFVHGVFRAGVPVLTFISGYLLFSSDLPERFARLVSKKFRTLVLPFVIWNFSVVFAVILIQYLGFGGVGFSIKLLPFDAWTWLNALLGISEFPLNGPLFFLRDLFVLMLLSPIFGWFLRKAPWIGLALISAIFLADLDRNFILRSTMPVNFYIGAMAATMKWDVRKLDRYGGWLFLAFLALCLITAALKSQNMLMVVRLMSPILLWPAASFAVGTTIGRAATQASPNSFAIFLMHHPLLQLLEEIHEGPLSHLPYEFFWPFATVFVVVACHITRRLALTMWPPAARLAFGGR